MTKNPKRRWKGAWHCTYCGAKGDSSNIHYKNTPNNRVALHCPHCKNRLTLNNPNE